MKVCEIWEDLEHPDNDYIFKYDHMVMPEDHAELLKKIMASKTCKYCKHFREDGPNAYHTGSAWCSYQGGRLMDSCEPDFYCGDFEEKIEEFEPTIVYPIKENHVYAVCKCCLPVSYGLDLGEKQPGGRHEYHFKCKRCGLSGVVIA